MADRRYSFTFRHCKPLIIPDSCSWPYDKTYDTQSYVGHGNAPECDTFNRESSYLHVPLTTVCHLSNVLLHSSLTIEEGKMLRNWEELEPPVQGPINREPDDKLFPERFVQKESGIRKL